jgi:hypothetical protein
MIRVMVHTKQECQTQNTLRDKPEIKLNILGINVTCHIPPSFFICKFVNVIKGTVVKQSSYFCRIRKQFVRLTDDLNNRQSVNIGWNVMGRQSLTGKNLCNILHQYLAMPSERRSKKETSQVLGYIMKLCGSGV